MNKILSNLLKNGGKCIEKCNFYIKYFFDKIKCYADRPYLVFSELKPETHIYFFLALEFYSMFTCVIDCRKIYIFFLVWCGDNVTIIVVIHAGL